MATDKTFDFKRFKATDNPSLRDGSDALANKGFVLSFLHLPSNNSVYFKAFITTFNESYSPDWAPETVYGRADPIYTFRNTTRNITLAFQIPAASEGEAYENLARVQELVQFLYPSYTDIQNANTISQSPLVRLKVMNLMQDTSTTPSADPDRVNAADTYTDYVSTNDASKGLLGVINNLTVVHNLENTAVGVIEKTDNTILPKLIDISLDFGVIHEHAVGWHSDPDLEGASIDNTNVFAAPGFPYMAFSAVSGSIDLDATPVVDADISLVGEGTDYNAMTAEEKAAADADDEGATSDQSSEDTAAADEQEILKG